MNNFAEDSSSGVGVGSIIGNKFRLEEKLGQGSFGMIFKCVNLENQEVYAIKMEKRNQRHSSMLVREIKVMMELKTEYGYARMITYGKDDDYNYVVMTNLGKNLDSILKKCGQRFSLATCMNIADQMITRLEILHNHNLIHRDIKPENFVIGSDRSFNQIYLIDFGLAKYYKDSEGNHIPVVEKKGMIGTARYASINAHQGLEQSRRDDLEALGYVLLYFIRGKLPWQQIYAETKDEKYEKIKNMKMNFPLEQLCEGCPNELVQYLRMVKKLEFIEQPNYASLKALFKKVIMDKKLETQSQNVDWESLPDYRHRKKLQSASELAPIPSQKEIALRQQQLRAQQLLIQQQQQQQQYQSLQQQQQQNLQKDNNNNNLQSQQTAGENDIKKNQRSSLTAGNLVSGQLDSKAQITTASQLNTKTKIPSQLQNVDTKQPDNNSKSNNASASQNNNNNGNKNIQVSPPNGEIKNNSQQNIATSPETGKFGAESRSIAIKDSELEKQGGGNEKQSKNAGSSAANNNQNNQNTSLQQIPIMNREVSVSIINNNPNFQQSSQNNSINGLQHTNNNSPVNNPNSSTNIGHQPEKRNSFLHAINHVHSHNNNNLLNVPTKDQVSLSVTSLTGTSKLNNYSGSDSDTIVDEGGIQISNMMIDRNMSPLTTSDIRKDIRTRSLVIRQSQLEIGELDMNRIQDHNSSKSKQIHSLNQFQNNVGSILKFDSSNATVDLQSKLDNSLLKDHPADSPSAKKNQTTTKKHSNGQNSQENSYSQNQRHSASASNKNISSNYRYIASAEEIREHQDEENNSNTKNIKNYKTQFTPITEVKESTYKSFKTKTSKASFIGENLTESLYENPIMINIMPIKRAFQKKY